jgi:hypothetical protein
MNRFFNAFAFLAAAAACARSDANSPPAQSEYPQTLPIASTPGAPQRRNAAANIMHFERAFIVDPAGFEQPMAASTLFLPVGWRWRGGVFWAQQYMCTNGYNFDWSAQSPDGAATIAMLPQMKWESNSYGSAPSTPGCQSAPYTDVQSYLQALVQFWKPGARVIDFRRRPDIEKDLTSYNSRTPMPMGEVRNWAEAGEVLFAFNENGRDMRGSVAASVAFSMTLTDAGMGPMQALTGFAFPAYGVTAPNGQLDFALYEAVRRSIKANPAWLRRISGHNTAIGRVALEEAGKQAAMIAQSNAEISRIREDSWNAYQESADRRAREFGEAIRGVQSYSDADAPGGTVELSHNYGNAWRMNDGTYVLTNDPNFEPYRDLGLEGRRLDSVR